MSRSRLGKSAALGVGLGLVAIAFIASREERRADSGLSSPSSSSRAEVSASAVEVTVAAVELSAPRPALEPARVDVVSARSKPVEAVKPTEAEVMAKLRELLGRDPLQSLALAREADQRFSNSADAPERAWFEARALVDLQRFSEAQQLARDMGERYPRTTWTDDVQRHLLTHPLDLPAER